MKRVRPPRGYRHLTSGVVSEGDLIAYPRLVLRRPWETAIGLLGVRVPTGADPLFVVARPLRAKRRSQ